MNQIIKEFIEALRDPVNEEKGRNYQLTKYILRKGDHCFCATGILGDILIKHNPELFSWSELSIGGHINWNFSDIRDVNGLNIRNIPSIVMNENGIPISIDHSKEISKILEDSGHEEFGKHLDIALLNDHGVPWTIIADILEYSLTNTE